MIAWAFLSLLAMANPECMPKDGTPDIQKVFTTKDYRPEVLIEVWWSPEAGDNQHGVLQQLRANKIPHTVVLSADKAARIAEPLGFVFEPEYQDLAIHFTNTEQWPEQPYIYLETLKNLRRTLKKTHDISSVSLVGHFPNVRAEATALKAGFRILLPTQSSKERTPRLAAFFPNQMQMGGIVPGNRSYHNCGPIQQWQPHHGGRFIREMTAQDPGITRISLHSGMRDVTMFLSWLDTVGLQGDNRPIPLRRLSTPKWRRSIQKPKSTPIKTSTATTQRLISKRVIVDIATRLQQVTALPRVLPHELTLTEAFAALSRYLTQEPDTPIYIGTLLPPQHLAVSQLSDGITFDTSIDVLRAFLVQWEQFPNTHVPSSVRLENTSISAAELLVLMSQAALEQSELSVPLIRVPDPRAPGLGWGTSSP